MEQPLVSVVIPAYNHEKFIAECLHSVINQTYKNVEIIVINDGSTDKTAEIVEDIIATTHVAIRFIKKNNEGLIKTLNQSIPLIKGEYVAFLASDDVWLLDKIEKQIVAINDHSDCSFVYTDCYFAYKNNLTNLRYSSYKRHLKKLIAGKTFHFFPTLIKENLVITTTVLIRTELLRQAGLFDSTLVFEDYDMWLRLAKLGTTIYIDEPLAYYRLHDTNFSKQNGKMIKGSKQTLTKHFALDKSYGPLHRAYIVSTFFIRAAFSKIRKERMLRKMRKHYNKENGGTIYQ